jgi:hypothetical protein
LLSNRRFLGRERIGGIRVGARLGSSLRWRVLAGGSNTTKEPDVNQTRTIAVDESEQVLVATARDAVSQSNWVVGECAAKWTRKYAKGRTDADFGVLVGLSGDQVFQRRRVWETFSDVREEYPSLKWSHFYAALTWDDAPECLSWAQENDAPVAEMRAWRRALRGEDLTVPPSSEEWGDDAVVAFVPEEGTLVRAPAGSAAGGRAGKSPGAGAERGEARAEAVAGVARGSGPGDGDYAPFRSTAGSPAPKDAGVAVADRPQLSPEQAIKRMTSALERLNAALTPELLKQFRRLPDKQRNRFVKAAGEFTTKVAGLVSASES